MHIEAQSGPFSGVIEVEARGLSHFRTALGSLYESLSGEARLEFWSDEHSVILKGTGCGSIEVITKVTDGRAPWGASLTVKMRIDQSYLPGIIAEIDEVFGLTAKH
jgi:carbon monoxide dehydrogenase subunit G